MTANNVTVTVNQASVTVTDNGVTSVVATAPSPVSVEAGEPGMPRGGATNDILTKLSGDNFHTGWTDSPTLDRVNFDLTANESVGTGQLAWNADEKTLDLGKGNGVVLQLGQENLTLCRNATASVIPDGAAVMFAGTVGASGRLLVAPMVADGTYPGYVFFGITTAPIGPGADGFVTTLGKVRGIDTTAYAEGTVLWCNPAIPGGLIDVEPQAPNLKLAVAAVVSSRINGTIYVRSTTGARLKDLHDVEANGNKDPGDVLEWSAAANRWQPSDRLTLLEQRVSALESL
jgi:hypothetical protein